MVSSEKRLDFGPVAGQLGSMLDGRSFLAAIVWGSIGLGVFLYGKRQKSMLALCGGGALMLLTYLVESALLMTLIGVIILAVMFHLSRR
jgi:hypothetical protein